MRHRVRGKKLGRSTAQRKALFRQLIVSLFLKEEIKTTLAKAKSIKSLVDKLVTKAKKSGLHQQRLIHAFLQNKKATKKLVKEIAPRFKKRTSGFTQIMRLGQRRGDNAMMVKIGLMDKKETQKTQKEQRSQKRNE